MYQQNGSNSLYMHQMNNQGNSFGQPANSNTSIYLNGMQAPVSTVTSPSGTTQQMSVYGSNINAGDNNAIFKDRLNDILGTSNKSTVEEEPIEDAMQSVKNKKKAAKIDAHISPRSDSGLAASKNHDWANKFYTKNFTTGL
jgi:hypothetical protein